MSEETTIQVSEDKFNGTATLQIEVFNGGKDEVKSLARRYFKETHGTSPSKVVAEKEDYMKTLSEGEVWTVMVADHSSGSLADSKEYTF